MKSCPEKQSLHHFVRVDLDNWTATFLGLKRGWPKILVSIASSSNSYRVFGTDETVLFDVVSDFASACPLECRNVSYEEIREMLSMPMVLENPAGGFNVYDFDLHLESARIVSVSTDLQINEGFLPGMKPIRQRIDGINERGYGAFFLRTHFTNRKKGY
jgi:hypothetical protein